MKKRYLLVIALLVLTALVFAACEDGPLTEIEIMQLCYSGISDAKSIKQEIRITQGNITQYACDKTYVKTDSGYDVSGEERRLNDTDAEEAYTVTEVSDTLTSATEALPTLKLDESYFEEGYRLTATGLTAVIKEENVKEVFSLSDDAIKSPTGDVEIELEVSGQKLSAVRVSYTSAGSNVSIELTMSY